jgi:NAD(P)H-nitrite reductase large subunit
MATVIATTEQLAPHPLPILPELADERVVCHCLHVTAGDIRLAHDAGEVETLRAVMDETRAGTGCTCCHPVIRRLLDE